MWISPHYTQESFPGPWDLDTKILLFADCVNGWQLDIALQVSTMQQGGYAALTLLLSYFEMYAKYAELEVAEESGREFIAGAVEVLGERLGDDPVTQRENARSLYTDARCGLYHVGRTTGVGLDPPTADGPVLRLTEQAIMINARALTLFLQAHFSGYVSALMDPGQVELRERFEARFDLDHPQA